jgi:hypothetical protein
MPDQIELNRDLSIVDLEYAVTALLEVYAAGGIAPLLPDAERIFEAHRSLSHVVAAVRNELSARRAA